MTDTPFDLGVTDELLSTTRAVRKRLDLARPVDRADVLDCIRLAQQAPTGSNRQPWRWVVVSDPGVRRGLADLYRAGGASYFAEIAQQVGDGQTQQEKVFASALHLAEVMHEVPVLVVPCIVGRPGTTNATAAGFYGSILPAVWSFQLGLRSRGLGSAWTTLHLSKEAEAAELLGIPDGVTQVALLPVAHTLGTDFKHAVRPPPETITYVDRWGAPPV